MHRLRIKQKKIGLGVIPSCATPRGSTAGLDWTVVADGDTEAAVVIEVDVTSAMQFFTPHPELNTSTQKRSQSCRSRTHIYRFVTVTMIDSRAWLVVADVGTDSAVDMEVDVAYGPFKS